MADDYAQVTLRYPQMRVHLSATLNAPAGDAGGAPRFAVSGTKGSLVKRILDPQETQLVAGLRPGDAGWGHDADPLRLYDAAGVETIRPALTGHQESYYAGIAELLTGTGAGPITLEEGVAVQEVIEAARISAAEGRVVALPLP
jgi:predicted dehydrogenase